MVEVTHEDEELAHLHGLRLPAGVHLLGVVEDGARQHSDDQRKCFIKGNHYQYSINYQRIISLTASRCV